MGEVIQLDRYRRQKEAAALLGRLDAAVGRLDGLVRARSGRLGTRVERELRSITQELSTGRVARAVERAERLQVMLEHPLASG